MDDAAQTPPSTSQQDIPPTIAFSRTVDWAIGAVLGLVGVLTVLSGAALYASSTRSVVTEVVQSGEFQSDVLTEAEAIDVLVPFGQWTGIGLVLAGGLLVALGVGVVVVHGRAREQGETTPAWILGVAGGLVSVVLSFLPLSPVLGGAAASYLDTDQTDSGLGTGALAGVLTSLPFLVVAVCSGVGLFQGVPAVFVPGTAVLLAFTALSVLLYFVVASAIGGYLGAWARERRSDG